MPELKDGRVYTWARGISRLATGVLNVVVGSGSNGRCRRTPSARGKHIIVIPAKAGIQMTRLFRPRDRERWIPAYAGMTAVGFLGDKWASSRP